jgi:hypothetical protein
MSENKIIDSAENQDKELYGCLSFFLLTLLVVVIFGTVRYFTLKGTTRSLCHLHYLYNELTEYQKAEMIDEYTGKDVYWVGNVREVTSGGTVKVKALGLLSCNPAFPKYIYLNNVDAELSEINRGDRLWFSGEVNTVNFCWGDADLSNVTIIKQSSFMNWARHGSILEHGF